MRIRTLVLTFGLTLASIWSVAQQFSTQETAKLDSLNGVLQDNTISDTNKVLAYLEIAAAYYQHFPDYTKYFMGNFEKMLLENSSRSMEEQASVIAGIFRDWKGEKEQFDDVCVLGIKLP